MSLQYYMLAKVEGNNLEQHEIFERLAYLRLMIEKLKPLDKKVNYQIDKLLRAAVTQSQGSELIPNRQKKEDNLRYKPNLGNFDTKLVTEKADLQEPTNDEDAEGEDSVEDLQDNESEDIDPDQIDADDLDSDAIEKYADERKQKAKDYVRPQKETEGTYKIKDNPTIMFNPVVMPDGKKSKSEKQRERDMKRMTRVDLVRELKDDMLGMPEEVNYGIASGNRKLIEEERADQELEMKYFQRINYTKKEQKELDRRRQKQLKSDYSGITDGMHDFQRIQEFMSKTYDDDSDEETRKQFEKQRFLDEHRNKRDKKGKVKFAQEEIDSDEAGDDVLFRKLPKLCK